MLRAGASAAAALRRGRVSCPVTRRWQGALPAHTPLGMPALSPTMEAGTLVSWRKKIGDEIAAGDVLAEVATDKATVDFECTDAGFLAKTLVEAGTADVKVGTLVAIIVEDAKDVAAFANYAAPAAAAAAPAPAPKAAAAAPAPAPAPAPAAPAPTKAAPPPAAKAVAAPPLPPLAAGDDYYAFARWGSSLQRSPLAAALAEQQNAYVALYGETGQLPLPMPETKKKAAA